MLVFLAAGGRFERVVAKLGGKTVDQQAATETIGKTLVAWAALFVMLSIMADFPATGTLASGFALLLMLTMLLAYGVDAFENIGKTVGSSGTGGSHLGPTPT